MEESNTDFILRLFQTHLNRSVDAEGLAHWVYHVDHGVDRAAIEACFTQNEEYRALHDA